MNNYSLEYITAAHKHSSKHRNEVLGSIVCGCFYCLKIFIPDEISDWIDEDDIIESSVSECSTALCPKCGIDSVIGDLSGYPINDADFLKAMNKYWF